MSAPEPPPEPKLSPEAIEVLEMISEAARKAREHYRTHIAAQLDIPEELLRSSHDDGCNCYDSAADSTRRAVLEGRPLTDRGGAERIAEVNAEDKRLRERYRSTRGGVCPEHGPFEIGPDCPKCIREVMEWTS